MQKIVRTKFESDQEFADWVAQGNAIALIPWEETVHIHKNPVNGEWNYPDGLSDSTMKTIEEALPNYTFWYKVTAVIKNAGQIWTPPPKLDTRHEMYRTVHFKAWLGGKEVEETSGFFHGFFQHQDKDEAGVIALVEDVSGKLFEISPSYMRFSDVEAK